MVSAPPTPHGPSHRLQDGGRAPRLGGPVHPDDEEERAGRRAGRVPGVVRLDLTVPRRARHAAPDGWVLLQNARAEYGIEAMARVGLDHIVLVRSIDANPFHGANPVPRATRSTAPAAPADSEAVSSYGSRAAADASR